MLFYSEVSGISSWRKKVVPGGDHVGDISEEAQNISASVRAAAVRPTDSISQAPSSGSSVISSVVRGRTSAKAPSTSALASGTSVVSSALSPPSVNILPASPLKKRATGDQKSTSEVRLFFSPLAIHL